MKRSITQLVLFALLTAVVACTSTQYGGHAPCTVRLAVKTPGVEKAHVYLLDLGEWHKVQGEEQLASLRSNLASVREAASATSAAERRELTLWLEPFAKGVAPVTLTLQPTSYHFVAISGDTVQEVVFNAAEASGTEVTIDLQ